MSERLSLAAAPTFAVAAILTVLGGGDHAGALCSSASSPVASLHAGWSGMATMYVLMAVFHTPPWWKHARGRLP